MLLRALGTLLVAVVLLPVGTASSDGPASVAGRGIPAATPTSRAALAPADPAPGTPEWTAREQRNVADSRGRAEDLRGGPAAGDTGGDPARDLARWSPSRGRALETTVPNRYGVPLAATLLRPHGTARPLPTVVLQAGVGGTRRQLHWLGQDLAEHGYLVVLFDPQGQGASGTTPGPELCRPGSWQRPQEIGIRETGACAGLAPPPVPASAQAAASRDFADGIVLGRQTDTSFLASTYRRQAPRFVFGVVDVARWARSAANPWRAWVDPDRLALAGHSLGAYAAAQVASGVPGLGVRAAVALDAFHPLDRAVVPTRPTLWLQSEHVRAPRRAPMPEPDRFHPTRASFDAARDRDVPAGLVVLRGSTHNDFVDGDAGASRTGQRVAAALTIDWLDRFVAGDRTGRRRLLAPRFDDVADRSSIGSATRDAAGRNVPVRIAGDRLADRVSYAYRSGLSLFGAECGDVRRAPCRTPMPAVRSRVVGRGTGALVVGLRRSAGDPPLLRASLRVGGRTVGRAPGRIDLGWARDEVRARIAVPAGTRGPATLVLRGEGFERRVRVSLR